MQTSYHEKDWMIPLAGIAVIAVNTIAAKTYLGLKRRIHAANPLRGFRRPEILLRNARLRCRILGSCLSGGS